MIRIALCDDEPAILDEVSSCICKYAEKKNTQNIEIARFDSARALKSAMDDGRNFDIYVLDVYIGDEVGTTLARDIRKRGIENPIMFLTSSLEHAPQSFETGTLRYLLKPLNPQKLYEALDASLALTEKMQEKQLKFKTDSGIKTVDASRITYSEAHAHYQYITLEDGSHFKVRMAVTELHNILAENGGFIRVGSAYIINLRCVSNITSSEVYLYRGMVIPIPRGKANEIKKAFWDFQYEGQEE